MPAASASEITIPRNTTIDPAHAYSDLFLDSIDLVDFIRQQHLNDTLANELHNFYNARNFQYAWFTRDGLTEQALAFSTLYQYSQDSSTGRKWLDGELNSLESEDSLQLTAIDPVLQRTEMLMTWRFMNYLNHRYTDKKQRLTAFLQLIPVRKQVPLDMARSLVADSGMALATSGMEGPWYQALARELPKYLDWQQAGGWGRLPRTNKSYKPGDKAGFIIAVKKRLLFTGEMVPSDTTQLFDEQLETAIKAFQGVHGLTPDGRIGPTVIKELNIPVKAQIKQILVNLQRMYWMPADADKQIIIVNIPDFRLQIMDSGRPALAMNVVVGKEGHSTVLFSGRLDRIIFNPYWNVPPSIVKKEILPGMEKDTAYLTKHDMETTGMEQGLPAIRQRPGEKNELGRIKFLFPNSFNIYLHDSPHKELFNMTRRAYSHGCIRVANARGLAAWLLRDMPGWSAEDIDKAIATGQNIGLKLNEPVAVLIVYYTAWVDEENKLQFREDIYGHDSTVAGRLFLP
ncbi:hypothetical protein GCM10011511_22210 [Puia dinghuensis]|uniref:L,D-TPase catalytic domain-containing protein n=1 Tax=Puia dinghuensis TaxID=1792502 RepID=A0A8J2UD60_9BACT|nr:hypothetical protein GCM10011511_22210 [Puia dinghuensis]